MDSYHEYFEAAVSCQKNLFKLVVKGSLTARYCVVLEELRIEAIRHIERPLNWPLTASGGAYNSDSDPNGSVEETLYGDMGTSNTLHIYESSLMGISNWAQFESLVRYFFRPFCDTIILTRRSRSYLALEGLTQIPIQTK